MNGVTFCLVGIPPRPEPRHSQPPLGPRDVCSPGPPPLWPGPRTLLLHKNPQDGFGFTLRHFIVYPPESAVHCGVKEEENGNRGGPSLRSHLEPMDTIFVKNVKDDGPAHQAGLRTGDRLVKVNGESIIGKTYSQVIALIQNSDDALELSIMPKDEDILQLAYSQDAYLKGNQPYSGEARSIPEPPPLCYPRKTYASQPRASSRVTMVSEPHSAPPTDHWRPSPWSEPGYRAPPSCPHPDNASFGMSQPRPNPSAFPRLAPDPRTSRAFQDPGVRAPPSKLECQQALSHWLSNQVPRRSGEGRCPVMPPRARSVSQDRLGDVVAHRPWPCSASQDTLCHLGHEGWHRARSDDYLGRFVRSAEALGPGTLVSPRFEHSGWVPQRTPTRPPTCLPQDPPGPKPPAQPTHPSLDDAGYIGYRSYSPSFQRRTGLLQALSFRDSPFGGLPTFNLPQPSAPHSAESSEPLRVTRPEPNTQPPELPPEERREEVVLRQKPPTGRKAQQPSPRQMNFGFGDETSEPESSGQGEHPSRKVAPLAAAEDSLASIPFIDEPTSPSIDLKAKHVPASAVVSSAMNSAPVMGTSPSSPTFTFALGRHYSQDCSSIKAGRRSSYLLAITTERSKSCDDGLNTFREEGRILRTSFSRRLPNRVPSLRMLRSFFTDGSLDSLGTSEDAPSKRHSTSDLSDMTFSDIRREGWLYFKQILTKKGKKVGGGLRQWKRVYAALRAHSLSLGKERREAGTAAGAGEEETAPVCISSCLVDISYSETKRRHVFRLTTADFCEYLFQAEDRDDMLGWIRAIRENSRAEGEDPGFANQALISKKLNDYRKVSHISGPKADSSPKSSRVIAGLKSELLKQNIPRSPRTQDLPSGTKDDSAATSRAPWGINIMKKNKKPSPRAFGVRLEECQPAADNQRVPLIVSACCRMVEARGLESMGIYRVPGNNAVVSSLQEQLNRGPGDINLQDERWQDLNVISSLLKSFFRKLPEPLFTDDKYNDFIEANRIEDSRERMKTLRKLIRDLPGHYYETLKFLVGHLKTIADHSEKNKMEPRNLALVFGPTLVRTSEDNMTDMVTHMPDRYKIVETLIQHSDWFFSDDEEKGERTPVDEKESQSVPNIEYLLPNIGRTVPPGEAGSDSINCGSTKSKGSWAPKKEPYAREMLAISFISAVNRKRKKRCEARALGSSTDDDSEQEAHKPGMGAPAAAPSAATQDGPEGQPPEGAGAPRRRSPPRAPPAADTRSIVSGYSTLSTMDRSVCSGAEGRGAGGGGAGDEADDERSELSHVETDTEGGGGPRPGPEGRLPRRPSFSSHHLMHCDTLARRRLSRSRPDGDDGGAGGRAAHPPADLAGSASSSSQESLRPPPAAGGKAALTARPSLTEQLRLRLRGSADDMFGVKLRRPLSPETRRRRSSWRRHTVVVQSPLTDLNFNEWKELGDGGALTAGEAPPPRPHSDNKDSGLSSLESTKARPSCSSASPPPPAGEPAGPRSQGPRRAAAARLQQCL
ncbi:rho GTPase-activating protein 23 isoform X3 [Sarcophilus harrisii]|uniref:rho GTPase-activating protein 23 isoform X3 n=1 Tax=Sarcophilus harrisii TaxID=9305 RepID=UPI001301CD7C|nr:rho GTPase-activating protein 23 isoform X3 [Sarcophilus harrisii]XP_031822000.1 rho GTPase-activating protein 23 isoform X3 [Sarcophilus harrisii]